ncbi:MAG: hypothetical protein JXA82_18935 [Sedimentisphaerales bacterium]|nr:hypothetical protein [Sedimentisphaerales bacterium]
MSIAQHYCAQLPAGNGNTLEGYILHPTAASTDDQDATFITPASETCMIDIIPDPA